MATENGKPETGAATGAVTTAERVYQVLLKMIISGEFSPGTRLARRKMAEMTGTSQIPVLEAMKRLEQDGLVEYRPQWGSVVTVPTAQKVKAMYVLREAIETQAVRILAITLTGEQAEELYRMARILDDTPYNEDTQQLIYDTHYAFHMRLVELTEYDTLISSMRKASLFWLLWNNVKWRRGYKAEVKIDWHKRLIDVILKGDPSEADEAMREHIQDVFVRMVKSYGESDAPRV